MRNAFLSLVLLMFASLSNAQISVPFTFKAGSPAKADEVNANFRALAATIGALAGRVSKLEGQIVSADVAGTYSLMGFQTGLIPDPVSGVVEGISLSGTVTLANVGTFTQTTTENGHDLTWSTKTKIVRDAGSVIVDVITDVGTVRQPFNKSDTTTGTWSLSGNIVTLTFGGSSVKFAGAAGGRILVATSFNNIDGSNVLLILVRSN